MTTPRPIELYVDGACRGNPGPGGYAAVLTSMVEGEQRRRELGRGFAHTTNSRMEIWAVLAGLETLRGEGHTVTVYSDSAYVVGALNEWLAGWIANGWRNAKGKPVENRDLWERVAAQVAHHNVQAVKVAGHADDARNGEVDRLAVAQRQRADLPPDEGYLQR
jgi:ribonuclease HI